MEKYKNGYFSCTNKAHINFMSLLALGILFVAELDVIHVCICHVKANW